jgi:hypothetical protein
MALRASGVRVLLTMLVVLSGCRTVATGVNERADALLADYRQRKPETIPATSDANSEWRRGQFTVHVLTKDERTVLERVGVTSVKDRLLLSIDRLGVGEQLRVRLTFTKQPVDRASFEAALTEAWVRRDEKPEVHHLGNVPAAIVELAWRAIERPKTEGGARSLTVPAGAFEGCFDGVHPAVPVSGVVSQRRDGEERELLEFGDDGSGDLY